MRIDGRLPILSRGIKEMCKAGQALLESSHRKKIKTKLIWFLD